MLPLVLLLAAGVLVGARAQAPTRAARGTQPFTLHFKGTTSSHSHPIRATNQITLWCAPDNPQIKILSGNYTMKTDTRKHHLEVIDDGRNATLTISHPTINDAGQWDCRLETNHGIATYTTHLYARPVAHPHNTETFSIVDDQGNHLEGNTLGVPLGESINFTCPVEGHPKPSITWHKDKQRIDPSLLKVHGNTLIINNVNTKHDGVYTCSARNEFNKYVSILTIDKRLRVKGEFSWVIPLIAIIVILTLLFLIIIFCELRRKRLLRKGQQQNSD